MRHLPIILAFLSLACGKDPSPRPAVLGCDDSGCSANPTLTGGSGGLSPVAPDAGAMDATGFDSGSFVSVTGSLRVLLRFPAAAGAPGTTDGGAAGWTVTPVARSDLSAMTDSIGRFTLLGVPTETFAGSPGRYYGLRARPVAMDLGSYQLFSAGAGAANLLGISFSTLLNSTAGAGVTPDLSRGHLIAYFLDSAGPTARPVPGVTVDNFREAVATLYDNELGTLSSSLISTGNLGVCTILNIAILPSESLTGHPFTFRITRGGRSATASTLVFSQSVTWIALLPP